MYTLYTKGENIMALVPARCTQCGANITVDESKEAGICENCGTAFITEKAIHNYVTNNSTTTNVQNQTNIYLGENSFEKEKKECKVLLMLLNKLDLQYLKEQALKVLSLNPDNSLAQTIYDCEFSVELYNEYHFLDFDEQPLHGYVNKEIGNIDAETCITFIRALLCKATTDSNVNELMQLIFKNLSSLNMDEKTTYSTYKTIATLIADVERINVILYTSKLNKTLGFLSIFDSSSDALESFNDADEKKRVGLSMLETRKRIASTFKLTVQTSRLSISQKNELASMVSVVFGEKPTASANPQTGATKKPTPTQTSNRPNQDTQIPNQTDNTEKQGSSKGGGIALIIVGALFALLFLIFLLEGSLDGFTSTVMGFISTICIGLGIGIVKN